MVSKKVHLVPGINEHGSNYMMYCNCDRMNPTEERRLACTNNCKHAGKHTVLNK